MKISISLIFLFTIAGKIFSQNVGIGVADPNKKLSVNGSVVIDYAGNNTGALDSAALLFGDAPYQTGIISNKSAYGIGYNGLDFWTGGSKRISIAQNGNVGINRSTPLYKLHVNGDMAVTTNSYIEGALRIGAPPFNGPFKLHVNNGDSYFAGNGTFTGDLMAQGNISAYNEVSSYNIRATNALRADIKFAVGGATDNNYRLRVYDGNSRMGGDLELTGTLDAGAVSTASLAINGKGYVSSNGPSALQIGFSSMTVDVPVAANSIAGAWLNLPAFSDADDMRVSLSNIDTHAGSLVWSRVNITVGELEASNDRVYVQFFNQNSTGVSLKGTLYFMTIQRN